MADITIKRRKMTAVDRIALAIEPSLVTDRPVAVRISPAVNLMELSDALSFDSLDGLLENRHSGLRELGSLPFLAFSLLGLG